MNIVQRVKDALVGRIAYAVRQKSWSNLWATSQETSLYLGKKVTDPYGQVLSVYKAVKAIADNVPQVKPKFYKDIDKSEEVDNPRWAKLFMRPNPLMSIGDFLQAVTGYYALYGECFIIKTPSQGQMTGASSVPAELWTFNPKQFQEIRSDGRIVGWRYGQQTYELGEIIHIKDFNPSDIFRGYAPTKPLEKILDIDYQSLVYNKAFFDNNALPHSFFVAKDGMGEDERERFQAWINKKFRGPSKAFKTALIEGDVDIKTVTQSHKDMDFIEQKKFSREEILGVWRVPKALFNITDDVNYATFMGQMKIFWTYGIMPVLLKIEDGFNSHLLEPENDGLFFGFDYSNVVAYQEDFKDKVETAKELWAMGFTGNEINERLGLGFDSKPWRDKWWIPFNQVPAGEAPVIPQDDGKSKADKAIELTETVVKQENEEVMSAIWKRFLQRHSPIEGKMSSALKRYFFEQRKLVLSDIEEKNARKEVEDVNINIDWGEQDDDLIRRIGPYLKESIDQGIESAREFIEVSFNAEILEARKGSLYTFRAQKITAINQTIKDQIRDAIMQSADLGETTQDVADRVRHVYNMAANRAQTIARTEVTGTMNGGSTIYYQEIGVKKKRWVVADTEARSSHQSCAAQGAIPMEKTFVNGLDFPGGEGPASEVINCRCTLIPVVKDE
jgi:HK97 family phage portal protein